MKNLRLGPLGGQSYLQEGARVFLRTGAAPTPLGRTEALVLVVLVLLFLVLLLRWNAEEAAGGHGNYSSGYGPGSVGGSSDGSGGSGAGGGGDYLHHRIATMSLRDFCATASSLLFSSVPSPLI